MTTPTDITELLDQCEAAADMLVRWTPDGDPVESTESEAVRRVAKMASELDQLKQRLEAAETVCTIYGWTGSSDDSDKDKACHQAWDHWATTYTSTVRPTPEWRQRIKELAAQRDEIRGRLLKPALARSRTHVPTS
ncbi:MAG TPA: hypothetical protein DGT23_20540 [Micromonosporaceae bacterium]|nr:hypothetical protein [Micromonosporaceae bacterium]